ncbi:MAG TPA: prepilin-type N-terminal cleavage/methylation domain-containing protein [Lacunisphaera sp.]
MKTPLQPIRGFTLLELLVVIGLIAGMTFLLFGGLTGANKAMALQSAQATVANLVTAARTKAPATNRKTRLLINADPGQPERYFCFLVLQVARQSGSSPTDWDTVQTTTLPPETYVVPATLAGLVANAADWKRVTDPSADIVSDVLASQALSYRLDGDASAQLWSGLAFTPNHTLAALSGGPPPKGEMVIAPGRLRVPGSYADGQPPVELTNPQSVRGLVLSAYGVPALLNSRSAF